MILILVLRNYRQRFKYICCEEKVFILFIVSTLAILVVEAALENLWTLPGAGLRAVLYVLQAMDYALALIIPMLWLYYCLYRIYHISNVGRLVRVLIAVPAAAFVLMMLVTLPGGVAFRVTQTNGYEKGITHIISYIVGYAYIVASIGLILRKRKLLTRDELVPYLLVPAVPIVLGIVELLQLTPYGLMWTATSLVILEIQMLVLNNRTNIDHLTSLNNRMALDMYARRAIHESHGVHMPLGLIMIDIDDFKRINDVYGHVEGDRALKATADILRECFAGSHFIARYGGDEFTVVLKDCSRERMQAYLAELESARVRYNKNRSKPYEIRLSVGASVFEQSEITDVHTLYMQVDRMMYENKNLKKERDAAVR